jgi:hypothetical protein
MKRGGAGRAVYEAVRLHLEARDRRQVDWHPQPGCGRHWGRSDHEIEGSSGSTDRWFRPDPVRYASVTTAMQGRTVTHHDP